MTTPVPPTPAIRIAERPLAELRNIRLRQRRENIAAGVAGTFGFAPRTVTNAGQKPSRQEKSLLQDDWSITRLRPNSVSIGCTETQFEVTPQSPQPSQTRSLIKTRLSGSGNSLALAAAAFFGGASLIVNKDGRARRLRRVRAASVEISRGHRRRHPCGQSATSRIFRRLVGDDDDFLAPSAATWRAIFGTVRLPSSA